MFSPKQSRGLGSEHPAVRSASKFGVEQLEGRLLLSTTTELAQDKAVVLRDGIADIATFADKLESLGGMAKTLPVIGKSVGQVFDLGGVIRKNVLQPVDDLLATDVTPTPEQIRGAIQSVIDALPGASDVISVVVDGNEVRFDLKFVDSQTASVPLTLGSNDAGLSLNGSASAKGTLDAEFSFGVDLTDGLAPEEAVFVDLNGPTGTAKGLKASASLDFKDFQIGGKLGAVGVQLGDGAGGATDSVLASADIGLGFKEPSGRQTVTDLLNRTTCALIAFTSPASV